MSPGRTTLLADAPAGRHIGQLHRGRQSLTQAVHQFADPGLRAGQSVVLIASAFHTALYLGRLREAGLDPGGLHRSGQLVVRDSQELLGGFIRHGMPRWEDFLATVGAHVGSAAGNGRTGMRIYGEMVSDLWRAQNMAACLRLEMYWNDLARLHSFSLLCGYDLGDLNDDSYTRALHAIGPVHTDLIETPSA